MNNHNTLSYSNIINVMIKNQCDNFLGELRVRCAFAHSIGIFILFGFWFSRRIDQGPFQLFEIGKAIKLENFSLKGNLICVMDNEVQLKDIGNCRIQYTTTNNLRNRLKIDFPFLLSRFFFFFTYILFCM